MPELPEVETLCRQLQEKVCGRKILDSEVYDEKLAGIKNLKRRVITAVERRGKTVTVILDNGDCVFIHLRMTGRLLWQESSDRPKYGRWRMTFKEGNIFLIDPRRFATIKVQKQTPLKIQNDLMVCFDKKTFLEKQTKRTVNVKFLLMDPKAVAGIGNIYACEILHRAGIDPMRKASSLSCEEWEKVFVKARAILKKGIEKRGTSVSDWHDLYGRRGENQFELKVYQREGKRCSICGGTIHRIKQGGRSTLYCPCCQK